MRKLKHPLTFLVLTTPVLSHANCSTVTSTSSLTTEMISAGYTAASWSGSNGYKGTSNITNVISVSDSSEFQPSGTLLASSIVDFLTNAKSTVYSGNQILFRCAISDASSLYEIYSRRASATSYAGRYTTDEVEDGYYSYVKNVAIRLTNNTTGEYYSKYWKFRQLTADDWVEDDTYIYIPASAFSGVTFEIFKIDGTETYSSSTAYTYSRANPQGQIAFKGPGLNAAVTEGANQQTTSGTTSTFAALWSITGVTFVRSAMCIVKDYPSVVSLPAISLSALNNGESSQKDFSISLKCESSAISGTTTSSVLSPNTAMGLLVNQATAVNAATSLGLTSAAGLTHLLDTNYGSAGVASGVGIRIYDESYNVLNLLSGSTTGTGNSGGWYAYKDLTTNQGDTTDGLTTYTGNFTASLEAIPGETITPGTVNAQLQVVVSFQ